MLGGIVWQPSQEDRLGLKCALHCVRVRTPHAHVKTLMHVFWERPSLCHSDHGDGWDQLGSSDPSPVDCITVGCHLSNGDTRSHQQVLLKVRASGNADDLRHSFNLNAMFNKQGCTTAIGCSFISAAGRAVSGRAGHVVHSCLCFCELQPFKNKEFNLV